MTLTQQLEDDPIGIGVPDDYAREETDLALDRRLEAESPRMSKDEEIVRAYVLKHMPSLTLGNFQLAEPCQWDSRWWDLHFDGASFTVGCDGQVTVKLPTPIS